MYQNKMANFNNGRLYSVFRISEIFFLFSHALKMQFGFLKIILTTKKLASAHSEQILSYLNAILK
jgi:hypothetical protein